MIVSDLIKEKKKDGDNSNNNVNVIIEKTQENSNIFQTNKIDLSKSKSKEVLNIEEQPNDNSLSMNNLAK